MELQLTNNLQPRASCSSSDRQMRTRVYNDRCCRCLLDSSPVAITNRCLHKFCVKCILYLWSRQKLREPCICPLDGEEINYLRSPTLPQPEEITSLANLYNPLVRPTIKRVPVNKVHEHQLELTLSRLLCVDMAFLIAGVIAYCLKIRRDRRP